MKYVSGSVEKGVSHSKTSDCQTEAYCDSDFAGYEDTRRSASGYVIVFGSGPISRSSRRQPIVAEYISAEECCKEVT